MHQGTRGEASGLRVVPPRWPAFSQTRELRITFTAANADGHEGDAFVWKNSIAVKYKFYDGPEGRMCELRAVPRGTVRYPTDGASPSSSGQTYSQPFPVPAGCTIILAQASEDGIVADTLRIDVRGEKRPPPIDPTKPATWHKGRKLDSTGEVFAFLDRAIRHAASLGAIQIIVANDHRWAASPLHWLAQRQAGITAPRDDSAQVVRGQAGLAANHARQR